MGAAAKELPGRQCQNSDALCCLRGCATCDTVGQLYITIAIPGELMNKERMSTATCQLW
jgi:hypothetical protein